MDESSDNQTERRWRTNAWAAAFAAPLIIAVLAYLLIQQVASANRLHEVERESQERRALLVSVLGAHQDVETGQRGYVITGDEPFLEPMRAGEQRLDTIFPQLARVYRGHPQQLATLARLQQVSAAKRAFAGQTVAFRRAGNSAAAVAAVKAGRGKALMDEIRRLTGHMMQSELRVLSDATIRSETAARTLWWVTFGLFGVLLLLIVSAGGALRSIWRERRETLAEIADQSARRAAILDSAMDGIIALNPSGSIEGANAALLRMFGYEEEELVSRDAGMLFAARPEIGQVASVLREMKLEAGKPGSLQQIIGRRKDGTTFPTDVAVSVAQLADGLRYVAVIRDSTERDRAERMKTEFVATVSHELRTPLTSIAGSLGLLAGGAAGAINDRAARLITIAHNNAERLVRLINDILDIEKLESGKARFDNRVMALTPALEQTLEQMRGFAQTYRVSLHLDAPHEPALIFADPDRFTQVMTNLLSNAIKFSPDGGQVRVTLVPGRKRHRITVRDQGAGIPDEFRARIFSKFAQADSSDTRAKGGTGLGLSIVHEIVTRLGGSVSFDSRAGEGTQFHVHLPAVDEAPEDGGKLRTVLLAGEGFAAPLREALQGSQYEAVVAADADEVHRLLDTRHFDALLLDMALSDGQPVRILRSARHSLLNAKVPVIALGTPTGEDGMVSDPALILDWLHKPVEIGSIAARLDADLVRWRGRPPRILHVDDDPDILRVVRAALGHDAEVVAAQSLAEARQALSGAEFDLVILDLTLRDGKGAELLSDLRRQGSEVPIVVFSAEDADQNNLDQLQAFLTKARTPIDRLVSIIEREIERRSAD